MGLRSISETLWHEHRNSELNRFHELAVQVEERAPPMLRNRPTGPTPLEREEQCRTHGPYRARCHTCVSGRDRADPHAMRNESEKGLPVVGVVCGYLWRGQRRTLVALWKQRTMTVISPILRGRNSRGGWIFSLIAAKEGQQ